MNRKIYYWKLRSVELQLGEKTLIMGILNVTPDSFSDGGRFSDPDRAYARALELEEQGADIIDIGAESTSPGSHRVSAEEEWRRLAPVLKRLRDKLAIPVSLDTYKAETARRAFDYGIEIVNDPSGLTFDADMAKTVAGANAGLILNHMRGTPETWAKLPPLPDMTGSVVRDLEATINRARRAGVERNRIVVDPGLGFGKRREQNSEILAQLRQLAALDCPVLVGPSRKSFLAQATETETLYATAAAVAVAVMNGAHIVRVHDVREMRAAVQIVDEVVRAADARLAAQAAEQAAERPVPRRAMREFEERPRAVTPPVVRRVPRVVASPAPAPQTAGPVADETAEAPAAAEMPVPEMSSMQTPEAEQPVLEAAPEVVAAAPPVEPAEEGAAKPPVERKPAARRDGGKEDRPPAKPYGGRPPRREFGDRPPSREYGSKAPTGDRPPRRDFGDRPPKRDYGSKAPGGDRPPRREFGDRPPSRGYGSKAPTGDRPPRRDFGDRPPRKPFGGSRPPSGDRPPRRDFGDRPAGRDAGPPRGKGPGAGAGGPRPPKRPFRKRP